MKHLSPFLSMGFLSAALVIAVSTQAMAQEYTFTAVACQWRLVRVPAGSATVSWTANVRNPTFTPDVVDLFIFRVTVTDAAGAIAIRTLAFTALPGPPEFQSVKPP